MLGGGGLIIIGLEYGPMSAEGELDGDIEEYYEAMSLCDHIHNSCGRIGVLH